MFNLSEMVFSWQIETIIVVLVCTGITDFKITQICCPTECYMHVNKNTLAGVGERERESIK